MEDRPSEAQWAFMQESRSPGEVQPRVVAIPEAAKARGDCAMA